MKTTFACVLALAALASAPTPAAAGERAYPATDAPLQNPERGFWRFVAEDFAKATPGEFADLRSRGLTIGYGVVRLDDFRSRPLSDSLIAALDRAFARSRKAGVKIILRFAYNYPADEFEYKNAKDAPLATVLGHIVQLKPVLAANADVIAVLQAGFIGAWGEGHTSSNRLTTAKNKARIRDALLDALPEGRMLQWRYPADVIDWKPSPPRPGRLARLGLHNDCFMASKTDVGTYDENRKVRERQRAYAAALSRATLYGGETCDVGSRSERLSCSAILSEGPQFHLTTLNGAYSRKFIDAWKDGGCFAEVDRSMGYRFTLTIAAASDAARRGDTVVAGVRVLNVGWARLYNPRPFQLVATHRATSRRYVIETEGDIRSVEPEQPASAGFAFEWRVPADAPTGVYDLALALPDAAQSLAENPAYAIRFANGSGADFGWDAEAGRYRLGLTVKIAE